MELDTIQSVIFKIKHSKAIHFKNILHAKKGRKTDKSIYMFFFSVRKPFTFLLEQEM